MEIKPAVLRDVSFIAANMRLCDKREIHCQVAPGTKPAEIAAFCIGRSESWTVFRNGLPSGAFGFSAISEGVLNGWAFGRPGFERCIPSVTRFVFRELVPGWLEDSVRRIEVRTIEDHDSAHRWLEAAGAERCCALEDWGRGGERFFLYAWICRTVPDRVFQKWMRPSSCKKSLHTNSDKNPSSKTTNDCNRQCTERQHHVLEHQGRSSTAGSATGDP